MKPEKEFCLSKEQFELELLVDLQEQIYPGELNYAGLALFYLTDPETNKALAKGSMKNMTEDICENCGEMEKYHPIQPNERFKGDKGCKTFTPRKTPKPGIEPESKPELSDEEIIEGVLKQMKEDNAILLENDFQTGEIEFSLTGELIPVELLHDYFQKAIQMARRKEE